MDVVGIGNAIVDVIAHADDGFLAENGLDKGVMTLIDRDRGEELFEAMGRGKLMPGGSAANTIAGVASLGGTAGFIGKVGDDLLGETFRLEMRKTGVHHETDAHGDGTPTGRCLIFVSPDAQRTMQTYLGASVEIAPDDIDADLIGHAQVTYLEGYLWDREHAKNAFLLAAEHAHAAQRKVALTLSDPFCVDRHRESFRDLVREHIDLLFANDAEIKSLYEVETFDEALRSVREECETAALTRGACGSVIVSKGEINLIDAEHVEVVVDTTGAGDLYAAGFLHGYAQGWEPFRCGKLAALCAAEVIGQVGARPETNLATLVKRAAPKH
jgi:sugar/nucleoside kinase (ribokinase family)